MEEKKLLRDVKGMATVCTGFFGLGVCRVNKEHTHYTIQNKEGKGVFVVFNKETHLSIFQHDLLYCLFVLKKKPRDFGGYFKCPAGKEFLESITEVWLVDIVPNPERVVRRLL